MRLGGKNDFDVTDVDAPAIDSLDGVLDVAGDVLRDYGPDPGRTRIERMARFIALNLGGAPYSSTRVGTVERCRLDHGVTIIRSGEKFALEQGGMTLVVGHAAFEARALAVALLRCAENADVDTGAE